MYKNNFTNYSKKTYNPKRAVKNFTDLDVYQKSLEAGVFAVNTIYNSFEKERKIDIKKIINKRNVKKNTSKIKDLDISAKNIFNETIDAKEYIIKNMLICALSIPHQIAESHSNRFGSSEKCLLILDNVMLNCNKMVVYLEQTRDTCDLEIEAEQFKEQIDKYFYIRRKVLNLQRVWKKYIDINKKEGKD